MGAASAANMQQMQMENQRKMAGNGCRSHGDTGRKRNGRRRHGDAGRSWHGKSGGGNGRHAKPWCRSGRDVDVFLRDDQQREILFGVRKPETGGVRYVDVLLRNCEQRKILLGVRQAKTIIP